MQEQGGKMKKFWLPGWFPQATTRDRVEAWKHDVGRLEEALRSERKQRFDLEMEVVRIREDNTILREWATDAGNNLRWALAAWEVDRQPQPPSKELDTVNLVIERREFSDLPRVTEFVARLQVSDIALMRAQADALRSLAAELSNKLEQAVLTLWSTAHSRLREVQFDGPESEKVCSSCGMPFGQHRGTCCRPLDWR